MGLFFIIEQSFVHTSSASLKPSLCLTLCGIWHISFHAAQEMPFSFVCLSFLYALFAFSPFQISNSSLLSPFSYNLFNIARPDPPSSQESWLSISSNVVYSGCIRDDTSSHNGSVCLEMSDNGQGSEMRLSRINTSRQ